MIKSLSKLELQQNLLKPMKYLQKTYIKLHLIVKDIVFFLKPVTRQGCQVTAFLFNIILEGLTSTVRPKKKKKMQKKRNKKYIAKNRQNKTFYLQVI